MLPQALESIDRYSTAATVEVLKAISELAKAAGGELRPYQAQLGENGCEVKQITGIPFF